MLHLNGSELTYFSSATFLRENQNTTWDEEAKITRLFVIIEITVSFTLQIKKHLTISMLHGQCRLVMYGAPMTTKGRLVGLSPSKKKLRYLLHLKPFKKDKKCFLFHLKRSFRSQDM